MAKRTGKPQEQPTSRRTTFTPDAVEAIYANLRAGQSRSSAAKNAGFTKSGFFDCLKTNPEFAAKVREAERSRLTPAVLKNIIAGIEDGLSDADAAAQAGVSKVTFLDQVADDEDLAFVVHQAIVKRKKYHLNRIRKGVRNWQSSAWFLERVHTTEFGRTTYEGQGEDQQAKTIRARRVLLKRPQPTAEPETPAEDPRPEPIHVRTATA